MMQQATASLCSNDVYLLNWQAHLWEGNLTHHLLSEEHHPGHPEEEDVVAGLKEGVGVEGLHVWGLVGGASERYHTQV